MPRRVGVIMDPIHNIKVHKDTTLALLLEAQRRGWVLSYMELADLWLHAGTAHARMHPLRVHDDPAHWFDLGEGVEEELAELDWVLMRKDPPFDMEFIYATYLLERAEAGGVRVINAPQGLRDANEKLFTTHFPQCCPPTLIARDMARLQDFAADVGESVVKPLDGMGGSNVFRLARNDPNTRVVIENLTANGTRFAMAQRFLPEIHAGDKRILLIDGEPVPRALARVPGDGDFRGNLARGAAGRAVPLSDRDRWICEQVAPELVARRLHFVGLDVIGDYLTEINVTSPTCVRELDRECGLNIAGELFDALESHAG